MLGFTYRLLSTLLIITTVYKNTDALHCYVCTDCETVASDQIEECPPVPISKPDSNETEEGSGGAGPEIDVGGVETNPENYIGRVNNIITDSRENYIVDGLISEAAKAKSQDLSVPETNLYSSKPSPRVIMRGLKQLRDDDHHEPRCMALFYEAASESKIKRGCTYASEEPHDRCKEIIGENDTIKDCIVCNTDHCNSATKSAVGVALLIIGFVLNL